VDVDAFRDFKAGVANGLRPDDVYYEKKPEKPKRDAKTVPCNIEHHRFQETRITGYRLKKAA
jgi:hypothetical protein